MPVEVRDATAADASSVADLFYSTVLNVNVGDYSVAQVEAWAGPEPATEMWEKRITEDSSTRRMFVATIDDVVVGFAEMEVNGHVDTLYVHHEYQGCGIASRLLARIEAEARRLGLRRLYTEASITAEPFFRARGFSMVRPQTVEVRSTSSAISSWTRWTSEPLLALIRETGERVSGAARDFMALANDPSHFPR